MKNQEMMRDCNGVLNGDFEMVKFSFSGVSDLFACGNCAFEIVRTVRARIQTPSQQMKGNENTALNVGTCCLA